MYYVLLTVLIALLIFGMAAGIAFGCELPDRRNRRVG